MDTPQSSSEQNSPSESADLSGVTISGQATVTAHDIIGRDKIIHGDEYIGYTAAQVTVLLDKIRTEYQSKPFDGHSPYIGLASFQERDADKFFGRETLTAELLTRVAASAASNARAVFVAGPSGSGKSSLVRAGLVPALKKGKVTGSEHWLYETLKPGRAPLDELARVVSSFANSPDAGDDLRAHALNDEARLHRWADIALKDDSQRRAVIVIDQFEEIFTQHAPDRENERVAFLNLLTHAATIENGRVLVIFTLRSDFVTNCASYPNLNALVNQQFIQVGAMTPDELVSAIARPAYQVGLRIDPALISQIVNDVRGEPGALPLMQFALQDLFDAENYKGELTLDGYLARGGLHEALERHADAEFAKLDDAEKQLARSVFSGLVEIGRGREDTKRTAQFGELVPAGKDATRVKTLITKLADARLITTDEQGGKETVTLAHERLIDAWGWLRKLVDENRDAIALQNEIAQDAEEWETHQHDESYLYRGARLATAQEKLQQNKLVFSRLAQEFVGTAIAARDATLHREQQRTRRLIVAFGAAALVFAILAVLAFFTQQRAALSEQNESYARRTALAESTRALLGEQRAAVTFETAQVERIRADEQSKIARSRQLAAQSTLVQNESFDLALLLSVESVYRDENFESRNNLLNHLERTQIDGFLTRQGGTINKLVFNSDGSLLASASSNGGVELWDINTHRSIELPKPVPNGPANDVAFDSVGTMLLAGNPDGTINMWQLSEGKILSVQIPKLEIAVNKILSASDHILAAQNNDTESRISIWDTGLNHKPSKIFESGDALSGSAFTSDGKKLAIPMMDGTISVWDLGTNQKITEIPRESQGMLTVLEFSPNQKLLAAGECSVVGARNSCEESKIYIWDTSTWRPAGEPLIGHLGGIFALTLAVCQVLCKNRSSRVSAIG